MCKHRHATLSGTMSPDSGKTCPGPGSKSLAKFGSTNMSPDPGEGFPDPVAKALKMSYNFMISPEPGKGRPGTRIKVTNEV